MPEVYVRLREAGLEDGEPIPAAVTDAHLRAAIQSLAE